LPVCAQSNDAHERAEKGVKDARFICWIDENQKVAIQVPHEHRAEGALFGSDQKLQLHVMSYLLRQRG
jgi:hypothetical protein